MKAIIAILLTGCQQFSLTEEFLTNNSSDDNGSRMTLSLGKSTVDFFETIDLVPTGGTSPYTYSIVEVNLFHSDQLGSFTGNTYTAGNSVGIVNIVLQDSKGETTSSPLSLKPPSPHNLSALKSNVTEVTITWEFNDSMIDGFTLIRTDSTNTVIERDISKNLRSFTDTGLNSTEAYSYELKTYTGTIDSDLTGPEIVNMNA